MEETSATKKTAVRDHTTWRKAFMASPGPRSWFTAILLFLKGVGMGLADIIPGVSGGTIAFITGIYEDLVKSIASFDAAFVKRFFKFKWKKALAHVNFRFLLLVYSGVSIAIFSSASLMHRLMDEHPVLTWSAFFGLIAGSIIVVFREVKQWSVVKGILTILGAVGAWMLCGMIPVNTPNTLWFFFLCGIIGVCAMILPGISGSFLLLVLGKYQEITGALAKVIAAGKMALGIGGAAAHKAAEAGGFFSRFDFGGAYAMLMDSGVSGGPGPFWMLVMFQLGQVVGIIGFSRVLKWLLAHRHEETMCVLAGMMIGAMRKIWPWKHEVQTMVLKGAEGKEDKVKVLEEVLVLPGQYAQEFSQKVVTITDGVSATAQEMVSGKHPYTILAIVMMVAGFAIVLGLEWLARGKSHDEGDTEELPTEE